MQKMILEMCEPANTGVWGVGVEGVSSLRFLSSKGGGVVRAIDRDVEKARSVLAGCELTDIEVFPEAELGEAIRGLKYLFVAPGIPIGAERLASIAAEGVEIISQTSVTLERYSEKVIGVTGTKGKSTFSTLLHSALKSQGVSVLLAGNIGTPPLDYSRDALEAADWIVMEMSSYQLDRDPLLAEV